MAGAIMLWLLLCNSLRLVFLHFLFAHRPLGFVFILHGNYKFDSKLHDNDVDTDVHINVSIANKMA